MKFNTLILKNYFLKTKFNENSDNIYLNSSFCFFDSFKAEKFFKNSNYYNLYSRFNNPTLNILQKKISFFDNSKYCLLISSGMSSVIIVFISFVFSNSYIISSKNLFSSTQKFFISILYKFNIITRFLNSFNINFWYKSICKNSLVLYIETPSNPLLEILDFFNLSYITNKFNLIFILDNTFCTSLLQKPLLINNNLIILYSCTKFLDGQNRVLAGSLVINNFNLYKKIFNFLKIFGSSLSIFNSWLIYKSLDLLILRLKKQSKNLYILYKLLYKNFFIKNIFFNFLYYNIYKFYNLQQISNCSLISFNIKGFNNEIKRINSWKIFNNIKIFSITSNLGDLKSIITHSSTTTHSSFNFLEKYFLFINESLIRISIGLEDIFDLYIYIIKSFLLI